MNRRTIVINPEIEQVIRSVQAYLVKQGWNASFSTAINVMILSYFNNMIRQDNPRREIAERARTYLEKRETGITNQELQDFETFQQKAKPQLPRNPTTPKLP